MDIVLAGIAVLGFAVTVLVLTGAGRRLQRSPVRTVIDPEDERWVTVGQLAQMLEVPEADVMTLVDRDAVPHFLLPGGDRSQPQDYRFRRDEIEAWIVG